MRSKSNLQLRFTTIFQRKAMEAKRGPISSRESKCRPTPKISKIKFTSIIPALVLVPKIKKHFSTIRAALAAPDRLNIKIRIELPKRTNRLNKKYRIKLTISISESAQAKN